MWQISYIGCRFRDKGFTAGKDKKQARRAQGRHVKNRHVKTEQSSGGSPGGSGGVKERKDRPRKDRKNRAGFAGCIPRQPEHESGHCRI